MTDSRPVALVTGVGPGTGAAITRRLAAGGYAVAMLARDRPNLVAVIGSTGRDLKRLKNLAHELQALFPFLVNGEKDGNDYQSVKTEFENKYRAPAKVTMSQQMPSAKTL